MTINNTLATRQNTHGDFETGAVISQDLCEYMRSKPNWRNLTCAQRESLEMIVHKIARILNGNSDFADHWHDVAGYATLAEKLCTNYDEANHV